MRLITYNIWHGGAGRADPLAEVLLAGRPDVVALVEADDAAVLERLAGRLKMDHVQAEGRRHAVALLSRWPIVQTINHALLRPDDDDSAGCFLEALVQEPGGPLWPIGIVHLEALQDRQSEQKRLRQVEAVLEVFARHRRAGTPHLLCGDFNAVSPAQQLDPPRLRPRARAVYDRDGDLPRQAVQRLLEAGYLDTFHVHHGRSTPDDVTFTTNEPCLRVDYIFAWDGRPSSDSGRAAGHRSIQIVEAWIEHDRLARYASDHFPAGAELLLDE